MVRPSRLLYFVLVLCAFTVARADTIITFEDLPDAYFFKELGGRTLNANEAKRKPERSGGGGGRGFGGGGHRRESRW